MSEVINTRTDDVKESRRDFLKNIGIAGAAALVASPVSVEASVGPANPDAEITLRNRYKDILSLCQTRKKRLPLNGWKKDIPLNMERKQPFQMCQPRRAFFLAMPSISRSA